MSGAGTPDRADPARLRAHVERLEGERHPEFSPRALARALAYAEGALREAGWEPARHPFEFRDEPHENVVAVRPGGGPGAPRFLLGAHVDTVRGSPGADDNASGVAGVLEAARLLAAGADPDATVELAVFNLEERQGRLSSRIGSRRLARDRHREGVRYGGVLVFEMIGFTTAAPDSQAVPLPIRWMDLPRTGHFLAAVGDRGSRALLGAFERAAVRAAPGLPVQPLTVPLRGWPVWATRRSDHAAFWDAGQPALLLTDTANLRNPHYHRATDRAETLDYGFMARVVDAAVETVRTLAGEAGR